MDWRYHSEVTGAEIGAMFASWETQSGMALIETADFKSSKEDFSGVLAMHWIQHNSIFGRILFVIFFLGFAHSPIDFLSKL